MRPALLRLLKRPSTLSVLESLLSSTSDPRQLRAQLCQECMRHFSFVTNPSSRQPARTQLLSKNRLSRTSTRHSSLLASNQDRGTLRSEGSTRWKKLSLQVDKLDYESDVGHMRDPGTRLVDDPNYRDDSELWLTLLIYRRRHYGTKGVIQIWEGLMRRVGGLHLPVDGKAADILWQSFVNAGLRDEAFLDEVADYAHDLWAQKGKRWPGLYQSIVGWFVKHGMADRVVKWHNKLRNPHLAEPSHIAYCFTEALADYESPGRRRCSLKSRISAFRELCKQTDGHQVYGHVINALVRSNKTRELLQVHRFLIERGDHPQSLEELQPLLQFVHMFSSNATKESIVQYVSKRFTSGGSNDSGPTRLQGTEDTDEVDGTGFNDDFGARIFATKALPLEMIIAGLKTFGVRAIGPLSLREMARRARGAEDIVEKLDRLKNSNISIKDSVFTRLLRRFAMEDSELLTDLIYSDQHHEVLEDGRTQAKLLTSYYIAGEEHQHDLTLVVLKELFGEGPDLQTIQLQKHISAGEQSAALDIVSDMLIQGTTPNRDTINWMVNHLFGPRKLGFAPATPSYQHTGRPLPDIFRLFQRLSLAGADVPLKLWNELLKRTGMADNWDDLRTCCIWLANHYSAPASSAKVAQNRQQTLQKAFDRHMQEAIVHWGFIANPPDKLLLENYCATGPKGARLVPFARSLMLLRELQGRGVEVRVSLVRRICSQRLIMLYGKRPFESALKRNQRLREINPYPLVWVLRDLNLAWGEPPLFSSSRKQWLQRLLQTHVPQLPKKEKKRRKNQKNSVKMRRIGYSKRQEQRESGYQGRPRTREYNVISYL